MFETGGRIWLRFNKKLIAGYSKAPAAKMAGDVARISPKRRQFAEFVRRYRGASLATLTREQIVANLVGHTEQANKVAKLIESKMMKIKILSDKKFERILKLNGQEDVSNFFAFTLKDAAYFRASTATDIFFGELVHEGTHVIDNINGVIQTTLSSEKKAFFYERQFQIATGMKPEYNTIEDMLNDIYFNYKN